MKEYYYIHSVCFWEGSIRDNNLIEHAKKLKSINISKTKYKKNLLIIGYCVDFDNFNKIDLSRFDTLLKEQSEELDIIIFPRKNTGGTTGVMWDVWKNILENKIYSEFFGQWEDDHLFKNENFLEEIKPLFDLGKIFVGSIHENDYWYDEIEFKKTGQKVMPEIPYGIMHDFIKCSSKEERLSTYRWCEDPYIMPYKNLKIIENKIGKFTLAPETEQYGYIRHGIFFGEVGFPSRLYLSKLDFCGILFSNNFVFLDETKTHDQLKVERLT